jgi:hypothetical protein
MPPNRKGSTDLAEGITNLNVASFVTTTKFQPLTEPQVTVQAVQEKQGKSNDSVPVVSYWDWPTDANSPKEDVVENILEEERIRQLFSVNRIASNFIAAAEKAASLEVDTVAVSLTETDDYWFTPEGEHAEEDIASQCADTASEPAVGVAVGAAPQNYWDFPAFKAQERERVAQDYWYTPQEPATGVAAGEAPQNYWDFPAFKARERVAHAVMEKNRIRQMLTVNHMQKRLTEQGSQIIEPAHLEATNDAYWVF